MKGETDVPIFYKDPPTSHPLPDIYYLIADYHFKNKEWELAIDYYIQDLTVCPKRLDSWAALSLAQKTQLEKLLNSCDVIEDEEQFLKDVNQASLCFTYALKRDVNHSNLWVEFGGLVYMTFSHASRLLKQDLNPDISIEMYQLLEDTKAKMLDTAEQCFTRALELCELDDDYDEESWLYYYMLGKIGEKRSASPQIIIGRYLSAARHLHLNAACYPSKVNYSNPQEFSVETLEMFFKVHSFIIKFIGQKDPKLITDDVINFFMKTTEDIRKSPFFLMTEFKVGEDRGMDTKLNETRKLAEDIISGIVDRAVDQATCIKIFDSSIEEIYNTNQPSKTDNQNTEPASDEEITVVAESQAQKKRKAVISRCLEAFNLCLTRFPHHYKSLYRLAQYYHTTKSRDRDNNRTRNYLIGCSMWQTVEYMYVNGLFHERKIWYQQPKNCNLFHGVWRIPNDEIDRPGSFAAHMYRCVSLALDVLPSVKDFLTTLDIALALKTSPEKDKKYLRENERQLLCEHATQVGLQAIKDKFRILFKTNAVVGRNRRMAFLFDVYRCYRHMSKHLTGTENALGTVLAQTYAALEGAVGDTPSLISKAELFCATHCQAGHFYNSRGAQQLASGRGGRLKRLAVAMAISTTAQQPVTTAAVQTQLQRQQPMQYQQIQQQQQNSAHSVEIQLLEESKHEQVPPSYKGTSSGTNTVSITKSTENSSGMRPSISASVGRSANASRSAPVPRSSATPVPRSTASPLPRKDATPRFQITQDETNRKAYKLYEMLIYYQTEMNKNHDTKTKMNFKSQFDSYQKQFMQYVKIPSVAQFFTMHMKQIDNSEGKLPKQYSPPKSTASISSGQHPSIVRSKPGIDSSNKQSNHGTPMHNSTSITIVPSATAKSSSKTYHNSSVSIVHQVSITSSKQSVVSTKSGAGNSSKSNIQISETQKNQSYASHSNAGSTSFQKSAAQNNSSSYKNSRSIPTGKFSAQAIKAAAATAASVKSLPRSLSVTVTPTKSNTNRRMPVQTVAAPVGKTSKSSTLVQLNTDELMKLAYNPTLPVKPAAPPTRKLEFASMQGSRKKPTSYDTGKLVQQHQPPLKRPRVAASSYPKHPTHTLSSASSYAATTKPLQQPTPAAPVPRVKSSGSSAHARPVVHNKAKAPSLSDPLGGSDDDIITLD